MKPNKINGDKLPTFLTIEELADVLKISKVTALELAKSPGFPAIRVKDKKILVPVKNLNEWIDTQAGKPVAKYLKKADD